jgi:hypothetical protein
MSSVATVYDCDSTSSIDSQAIVGIDLEQKGMAMPQRYGSASSYGKKYALGNLLLIDDTQDADATNGHGKEPKNEPKEKPFLSQDTEAFFKAQNYIAEGGEIELIEKKYTLTALVKKALLNK